MTGRNAEARRNDAHDHSLAAPSGAPAGRFGDSSPRWTARRRLTPREDRPCLASCRCTRRLGHTGTVRVYLPTTLDGVRPGVDLVVPRAHAVTAALRAALPDADDEGLEYVAQLAAADDALLALAADPAAPRLRVVVAADVSGARPVPDGPPTAVDLSGPVVPAQVACLLVDEPAAAPDVAAAVGGDQSAYDRLEERDLLWYDVSEIGFVPRA